MFNGVDKEEYENVVRANNELRMKMEKLRLENALLKDQIRVFQRLQPELAKLYVAIQLNNCMGIDDIKKNPQFKKIDGKKIEEDLQRLMNLKLIDKIPKNGVDYYSIRSPDIGGSMPKPDKSVRSGSIPKMESNLDANPDDIRE